MSDQSSDTDDQTHLRFHYIKSNFFRVVYAEGAYGGISPRRQVVFSLYNERQAIPRVSSRRFVRVSETDLRPEGEEEIEDTRGGVVREVEVEVVMSLRAALEFHEWLGGKIEQLQSIEGIEDAGASADND